MNLRSIRGEMRFCRLYVLYLLLCVGICSLGVYVYCMCIGVRGWYTLNRVRSMHIQAKMCGWIH